MGTAHPRDWILASDTALEKLLEDYPKIQPENRSIYVKFWQWLAQLAKIGL